MDGGRLRLVAAAFGGLLVLLGLGLAQTPAHAVTVIDSFDTSQALSRFGVGNTSSSVDVAAGQILGNERDVFVTVTTGNGSLNVDVNLSLAGGLSHAAAGLVRGTTLVTYDGNDDNPTSLNPTGLGGVDLTNGGLDSLIYVVAPFADLGASLAITVHSDATRCSRLSQPVPPATSPVLPSVLLFRFIDFTVAPGCANPADFTNVGALSVFIDGTSVGATDLSLDIVAASAADLGDLPPAFNNTLLADNGPRHVICTGFKLGANIDDEPNGQQSGDATGDDVNGVPDDEDGVVLTPSVVWSVGSPPTGGGSLDVTVMGDGCLSGWIDWTNDNDFNDPGEVIFDNLTVTSATTTQSFTIPIGAVLPGLYFARFRLYPRDDPSGANNCTTPRQPIGSQVCGEVEDYRFDVMVPTPTPTRTPTITNTPTPTHTPTPAPICGNGALEMGELCDDGNMTDGDGCDTNCTPTRCGNGIVTPPELCDDGNSDNLDGCENDCTPSPCFKNSNLMIPGYCNTKKNDCMQEFCVTADSVPTTKFSGLPGNVIECTDDDTTCDVGAANDHTCTFRIAMCFNVADTRFACNAANTVEYVRLRRVDPRRTVDVANRDALESALVAMGGALRQGPGVPGRRAIRFTPPMQVNNTCSPFAEVKVPLRPSRNGAFFFRGRKNVVLVIQPPRIGRQRSKHDSDYLTLVCNPK